MACRREALIVHAQLDAYPYAFLATITVSRLLPHTLAVSPFPFSGASHCLLFKLYRNTKKSEICFADPAIVHEGGGAVATRTTKHAKRLWLLNNRTMPSGR
ncbi:hypothetical protein P3342_012262 [Pyrenophora teres f. teres]|nr:hypothetical protein P3342_012262 [Pyrenophora teres f. teres]